jgi:hypothetical protein
VPLAHLGQAEAGLAPCLLHRAGADGDAGEAASGRFEGA